MVSQTFKLNKNDKSVLLQEFDKVAEQVTPPLGLLSSIKYSLRTWLCLNLTVFIQSIGYNQRQVVKWQKQNKKVIINIGSLGAFGDARYLNGDLLLGLNFLPKILSGTLEYDLLLNITSCDRHLLDVADGIFLSHVLEHIPPNLALQSLRSCLAYLKPGACLRIVVPDLDKMNLAQFGEPRTNILRAIEVNQLIYGWGHKFMYNRDLVSFLMEEAGFTQVKQAEFREGLLGETDLAKYKDISIYVTGIKG